MKNITIIWGLCILIGFDSVAQSSILDKYVAIGLESNLSLKQENLELDKALKSIEIAKSSLFPKISFAPNYSLAAGGRRLSFPIGDLLNPVYSSLNKLTQTNNFPAVENVNQLLAPNNFHDTKFTFQYPIFNSDIKYNIALQKELLNSEYAKKKFLEFELRHNIEIAYFQFLQANHAIKIYEASSGILKDFNTLNQKLVNNKVALKDVLLSSEYEIIKLEQQISTAKKNVELAKSYLNFLMNQPLDNQVIIDSSLISKLPVVPSLAALNETAIEKRPEFTQLQSGLNVSNASIVLLQKNAKLPQFYLGANTGFQGFGYSSFINQAYLVAQLSMQWEIFNGGQKKLKIEQSKISKSILEVKVEEAKSQVELQVKQAYLELNTSVENVITSNGATKKTEKILEIVNSRYKNGNAIFVEVSKAQNDDLQARLLENLARFDTWLKYANLKKVTGL